MNTMTAEKTETTKAAEWVAEATAAHEAAAHEVTRYAKGLLEANRLGAEAPEAEEIVAGLVAQAEKAHRELKAAVSWQTIVMVREMTGTAE